MNLIRTLLIISLTSFFPTWCEGSSVIDASSSRLIQANGPSEELGPSDRRAPSKEKAAKPEFRRLRPALFGLAIERQVASEEEDASERYRLVRVRGAKEESVSVVLTGDLDACESALIKSLEKRFGRGKINIPTKTLGGAQFWSDEFMSCGWRIQTHVYTGHSRLLDDGDTRRAWGTFEACRVAFEKERLARKLAPKSKRLVLLVHGLFRTKDSFSTLASSLEKQGFDVASITYPSTRRSIREHADQLGRILANLPRYDSVSFVTHSLGGIVVRDALHRKAKWQDRVHLGRVVMLAPPNRGSVVAKLLENWFAFKFLTGEVGKGLTPEEVAKIPAPDCEFGIIAGGNGTAKGMNPLLPGDDDGTVLVENTKLPSAKDFLLVESLHSFIMRNATAIEATARFLKEGSFKP